MKPSLCRLFSVVLIAVSFFSAISCQPGAETKTSATAKTSKEIKVEVAPFDIFPSYPNFGFRIRFSEPVTQRGDGRDQTPAATLTPLVAGAFSWNNDSELFFQPQRPLPSESSYDVDLSKLALPTGKQLSATHVTVRLPAPFLKLTSCELRNESEDPITKKLHVTALLNFPIDSYWSSDWKQRAQIQSQILHLISIQRSLGGVEETIPTGLTVKQESLELEFLGNDMLRPGKDGSFKVKLDPGLIAEGAKNFPGDQCEVKFLDTDFRTKLSDSLADSEAKKIPSPALPTAVLARSFEGKEPLTIQFVDPLHTERSVSHKRPAGEIVEKGLSIDPPVPGQWKIGEKNSDVIFEPAHEWMPGQTYVVTVDPTQFPELQLSTPTTKFDAYELKAKVQSVDVGTVPEDKSRRVLSAELAFNYPVKAEDLEKIASITLSQKGIKDQETSGQFSVEGAKDPCDVYVRTEALTLKDYPLLVKFGVKGDLASSLGGKTSAIEISRTRELPSRLDIFSVQSADLSVAKSSSEELQRILSVTVSEDADESAITAGLHVELLPDCKDKKNAKLCDQQQSFYSELQATSEIEKVSEKLPLTFVSRTDTGGAETYSFSFQAPGGRQVLAVLNKGITSKLGFPLANDYRQVLHLKEYPKRLNVMMDGALLSLSGTRRLGILAQNIHKIRYRLSRVKATDLHHLVYVTDGSFKQPNLKTSFTYDDMAQPIEYTEQLPDGPSGKPVYTSVDLSHFSPADAPTPRGLFFLEVKDADTKKKNNQDPADVDSEDQPDENADCEGEDCEVPVERKLTQDSRLVLLTDLGLIVKRELNGSDHVYVASFRSGLPVMGAVVKLVSRNGTALFTAISDRDGQVTFPSATDFKREKEPALYTAEKAGDLTFIPYERRDRALNLSRFDVGGVVNSEEPNALRALVFSDRGIYRPGETAKFSLTVRNRDLMPLSDDLPLMLKISDPRGQAVAKDVIHFQQIGMAEYSFDTAASGMTGTYRADLIIPARKGIPDRLLGGVDFRVEEFEPDRLAIHTALGSNDPGVFKKIDGLLAHVDLKNLFGVPAAGNTVKASIVVDPWEGHLDSFPGYNFRPMLEYQKRTHSVIDLGEATTSDSGVAEFKVVIPDVAGVVLDGVVSAEGFEKDSGRSVASTSRGLMTDLSMLVGVKATDALDYVAKGAVRNVQLQSINLAGQKIASGALTLTVEREEYKNILVKQTNGIFKYESAKKLVPVSKESLEIPVDGKTLDLKTTDPGSFVVSITDSGGVLLNQIRYMVAGEGNDSIKINRNANLDLVLNKPSYGSEDNVEISIKGPYPGFGVITIERDKVLATKWFQMDGTSTVQTITLPATIIGNAYVTVLLARSWDSKEIYLPPLSYASLPVKISETEYSAPPRVEISAVQKPGAQAMVHYSVPERGSLLLYAVDEGILQFAKYKAPDPLRALLPKRALEVETRTALDMVMPDYSVVQSVLSTGGDESVDLSKYQNPFKKKARPPFAVWSGIQNVEKGDGQFAFAVPDYFDGAVKVFAYFVGEKHVGFTQARSEIRGDFVIKATLPNAAAPGDEFDVPVEVTNTLDTEKQAVVSLSAKGLEVIGGDQSLALVPSIGQVAHFRLKAGDTLGEAVITLSASAPNVSHATTEGISIRPASPLMRTVKFGVYDPEKPSDLPRKEVTGLRDMYNELRSAKGFISLSPGLFVDSLNAFMENYPYGCTEQLTSKGFISLLLSRYSEDSKAKDQLTKKMQKTLRMISSRMNSDGSIAYWRRGDPGDGFASVYAAHLIIDAASNGYQTDPWFLSGVKQYLVHKSAENVFTMQDIFVQSYALYVRARSGDVVTKQLNSMVGRLDALNSAWKGSAISWLVASTYELLHLPDDAKRYTGDATTTDLSSLPFPLNSPALNAGLINYLKVRHFGGTINKDVVFSLLNRLDGEQPDSLSAAALALGLSAGDPNAFAEEASTLKIETDKGNLPLSGTAILQSSVDPGTQSLAFTGPKDKPFFYSVVEDGFDKKPARQGSRTQGVSLARDVIDDKGQSVSTLKLGVTYHVVVRVKSEKSIANFAVQDLLATGIEPDLDALRDRRSVGHESNEWHCQQVDVRDDRLLLFGNLENGTVVFSYPVRATVKGTFQWPGIYGEAMYDSRIFGWENSNSITVE